MDLEDLLRPRRVSAGITNDVQAFYPDDALERQFVPDTGALSNEASDGLWGWVGRDAAEV